MRTRIFQHLVLYILVEFHVYLALPEIIKKITGKKVIIKKKKRLEQKNK